MRRRKRKREISPKYLFLILSMICVIFLVLSYVANSQIAVIKEATTRVITPIQSGINTFGLWFDSKLDNLNKIEELNEENKKLKDEIAQNREELTMYQNQISELYSLQELYNLDKLYPKFNKTAAHVYAKDSSAWFSVFYIDKGTEDGLFKGANVMCDDGLAGVIVECYSDHSKVRAIINDRSNISAKILPSNAVCTVEGSISNYDEGVLAVKNIDKSASVDIGDKVVTSLISDRYHAGITIGYIKEIEYDSNNMTKTAYIQTAVDFEDITDVLIITDKLVKIKDEETK